MKLNRMASHREFLRELSTHELDAMLQAELRKEDIDDDLVRIVLSVLEEREKDYPVELTEEVVAAAEKFGNSIVAPQNAPARKKWPPILKVASILVVVGLLFCIVPQAAHAESFFELLARWTDSIFEFFSPGDDNKQPEYVFETDHPGLQQIYDAVVEMGVTDPVVPMWVPKGYELKDIYCYQMFADTTLFASLVKEAQNIYITITLHDGASSFRYEKDVGEIEQMEINGIEHYIISNLEEQTATWVVNQVECSVVTDCQKEELIKLLKSIYSMGAC